MRLDEYLVSNCLVITIDEARNKILAGLITVNNSTNRDKSYKLKESDIVAINNGARFVSRSGEKLYHALKTFNIDAKDKVCLDIGSSTGGFTDCLLQNGASHIYALDVGHNQLAYKLRKDSRVTVIEDFNAKEIKEIMFKVPPEIIVSDVSFISIVKIAPIIFKELTNMKFWISLIKPQFEAERSEIERGGIIRDDKLREAIVKRTVKKITDIGFIELSSTISPIKGTKGNIEYLSVFIKRNINSK